MEAVSMEAVALFGKPVVVTTRPGLLKMKTVQAAVVCCPDFKLREQLPELIHRWKGFQDFDDSKFAGGVMRLARDNSLLSEFKKDFALFYEGHGVRDLVLLSHDNCAWCTKKGLIHPCPDTNRAQYAREMIRLKYSILTMYSDLRIHCGHLRLVPDEDQIHLMPVLG